MPDSSFLIFFLQEVTFGIQICLKDAKKSDINETSKSFISISFESFLLFIFSNQLIPVMIMVDKYLFPETLGVSREYTLDSGPLSNA